MLGCQQHGKVAPSGILKLQDLYEGHLLQFQLTDDFFHLQVLGRVREWTYGEVRSRESFPLASILKT
jgi:hypothetical protein